MVNIIGGGLAGVEAALFLANLGVKVNLYEMRPKVQTEVHKTSDFAELVCSNSFRSTDIYTAIGLLKTEMEILGSKVIEAAKIAKIEAGTSLNVDREKFSKYLTKLVQNNENITIIREEIKKIDLKNITIIAAGPLCSDNLKKEIGDLFGEDELNFFDAVAPIISFDSINLDVCYFKDRYDKGEGNYLNCPMNKEQYDKFLNFLMNAEKKAPKEFEKNVFDGCMPIEAMASRGYKTLLFGPMKPVGLDLDNKPKNYAVVQLRPDDNKKTMYNIVGFQTSLTHQEQKHMMKYIPGLENAKILRFGQIHQNFYINSPSILDKNMQTKKYKNIFFAGQISGVEGYLESAANGLLTGICVYNYLNKINSNFSFPKETMIGALCDYLTLPNKKFLPMNANFGLFLDCNLRKKEKKIFYYNRSIELLNNLLKENKWITKKNS